MSIFRKTCLFMVFVIVMLVMTGCLNKQTPTDKIYELLETVVATEKDFEEQQDPLVELERKEKVLYDQIISLGMKEFDQIVKLSDEALAVVEQRKEHIDREKQSITSSKEQFVAIVPFIEELEEEKLREKANALHQTMLERYETHEELYENYSTGIQYDRELYNLFKQEDLSIDELEEQITKINEIYAKVLKANETFNEKTEKYNDIKLEFYKEAGLDIKQKSE
ncbi:YkyA family protein [Cytobacillus sp. FJAT-54145]|uniref:YkyA family protein n=1 Tax=Cytobacillus spartinae TaxID=3299023 RepID=A0ABW6KLV3_9BACI